MVWLPDIGTRPWLRLMMQQRGTRGEGGDSSQSKLTEIEQISEIERDPGRLTKRGGWGLRLIQIERCLENTQKGTER